MSTPTNDGGPAFPGPATDTNPQGMSLRDYFAAQCMAGILMNYTTEKFGATEQTVATYAYRYADAMLKARKDPK